MYQGGSDSFLGPRDPIPLPDDESLGLDLEAEVAVVTDDVPVGIASEAARSRIRLVMLANDVTLRGLVVPSWRRVLASSSRSRRRRSRQWP